MTINAPSSYTAPHAGVAGVSHGDRGRRNVSSARDGRSCNRRDDNRRGGGSDTIMRRTAALDRPVTAAVMEENVEPGSPRQEPMDMGTVYLG